MVGVLGIAKIVSIDKHDTKRHFVRPLCKEVHD